MTRATPSAFPALRRVFSGYLHEDAIAEHGSVEAALNAFRADASPVEWRRFQKEAARFLKQTAALDPADFRSAVDRLGCRILLSRKALLALLT